MPELRVILLIAGVDQDRMGGAARLVDQCAGFLDGVSDIGGDDPAALAREQKRRGAADA